MAFWKRLLITIVIMLAASFLMGALWREVFNMVIPSYIAGIVGGLTALPVWEFLKRIKAKKEKKLNTK